MFDETQTKNATRFYLSEQQVRATDFESLERLGRFIGCLPDWPRESKKKPGQVSRRYKRALIENVLRACCKPKEVWEIRI